MQFFVTFSVPAPTHKYIYLFLLFFTFFIYLLRDEIEKMILKFKSYFFKLSISILKSNYISWCKIMQNGKMCSFYTFWVKKCGCKIVHLCTIAIVTMHICTVTVALAFIILLVFSLSFSLSLGLLSLSPHSHCHWSSENATSCINREHHIKKFLPKSSKTRN